MFLCRGLSCKKGEPIAYYVTVEESGSSQPQIPLQNKKKGDLFLEVPRETVPSSRHWYPALYIYLGPEKTFQQYGIRAPAPQTE